MKEIGCPRSPKIRTSGSEKWFDLVGTMIVPLQTGDNDLVLRVKRVKVALTLWWGIAGVCVCARAHVRVCVLWVCEELQMKDNQR